MENKNSSASGGVGLSGFLFLIFITLKLTGFIDWSWWWVTSPLWISALLGMSIVLILALFVRK